MPHPSILIAFGSYGMQVLRSFLAGAAMRGALTWNDGPGVGALNERRLDGLSFFWVPDEIGNYEASSLGGQQDGNNYELMDDLFRQIEPLQGSAAEIRSALAEGVEREKRRLLNANLHGAQRMLGLDVYILAQPASANTIGLIRNYTELAMKKLASDPTFQTAQSRSLLNFISLLDFDDYWGEEMLTVRSALRRSLDDGAEAQGRGEPAVGRVYVFDGHTDAGARTADSRRQEVVLFLELLLLENLRSDPSAKDFYESENNAVPALCSVGIRVVERSSGMLRRLAAAAFAHQWLDYLISKQVAIAGTAPFHELMEPFRGTNFAELVGEPQLHQAASAQIARMQQDLQACSPESERWLDDLRRALDTAIDRAILSISRDSGSESAELVRKAMQVFRDGLEPAITHAIQTHTPTMPLGAVIADLEEMEKEFSLLSRQAEPVVQQTGGEQLLGDAAAMQREYRRFLSQQLHTSETRRRLWSRLSALFAIGLTPVLLRGLSMIPFPVTIPAWAMALFSASALWLIFFVIGRKTIQPALDKAADHARAYYKDPVQGRLTERVRRIAASPLAAGRIEAFTEHLALGLRQYLLVAIAEELRRVRVQLENRCREMQWLRGQLGDFLRSSQVEGHNTRPQFLDVRLTSDVRCSLERDEDLQACANSIPSTMINFRDQVRMSELFKNWQHSFGSFFLHPLRFLDGLSEHSVADPFELDQEQSRQRAMRISEFVQQAQTPVCFHWLATDGLPVAKKGALVPALWKRNQGIDMALTGGGVSEHTIESKQSERLYLYKCIFGIPSELLVRRPVPVGGQRS